MSQLLLLVLIVAAAALWLSPELRQRLRGHLPRVLPWVGVVALALLVATGRLHWLVALAGASLVFVQRGLARWLGGGRAPLETRFLKLRPGDTSTPLDGEIKAGRFRGRKLSGLDRSELKALHGELREADAASLRLLEAYLDHIHGTAWRGAEEVPRGSAGDMSVDEAYAILGLAPGAEESAIIAAHRRLMQRLHPDRGGSDYLAARINEAKRRLMGERA